MILFTNNHGFFRLTVKNTSKRLKMALRKFTIGRFEINYKGKLNSKVQPAPGKLSWESAGLLSGRSQVRVFKLVSHSTFTYLVFGGRKRTLTTV